MEHITEMTIGKTVFVVCAEHSPTATETATQKIKKLVLQHAFDNKKIAEKPQNSGVEPLDMCESLRLYSK